MVDDHNFFGTELLPLFCKIPETEIKESFPQEDAHPCLKDTGIDVSE